MNTMIKHPALKRTFILLLWIWAAIFPPLTESAVSVEPLSDSERLLALDLINNFRAQARSCRRHPRPLTYPAITSAKWDTFAEQVARQQAVDIATDDSLDQDYKQILDREASKFGFSAHPTVELLDNSLSNDSWTQVIGRWFEVSRNCKQFMRTGYLWNGIGLAKAVRHEAGFNSKYFYVLILYGKSILGPLVGSPVDPVQPPDDSQDDEPGNTADVVHTQDLVVTKFYRTGAVEKFEDDTYQLPVHVVVHNQGLETAGTFRIGIWADDEATKLLVPFTVLGQDNLWKPLTSSTLKLGESITLEGRVAFNPEQTGQLFKLFAVADDCGDDLARFQGHCDVPECDETNNESTPVLLSNPHRRLIKWPIHLPIKQ